MKLKIHKILIISLLLLGLSFPTVAQAKRENTPQGVPFRYLLEKINALKERVEALEIQVDGVLQEYVIETEYHHLGDDYMPELINPEPEGLSWEKSFTLPDEILSSRVAFIKYYAVDIQSADIVINGIPFAMPFNHYGSSSLPGNQIISVPAAIFQPGENVIEVVSEWDDFEFGELEIWFQ